MAVGGLEEASSSTGRTSGDARPAERSPRSPIRGALQAYGQISFGIPAAESNIWIAEPQARSSQRWAHLLNGFVIKCCLLENICEYCRRKVMF